MDINYFPGRIRLRDAVLKDDDIREAAVAVAKKITAFHSYSYNPKTGSVLIEYDPATVDESRMLLLKPFVMKLRSKVLFYSDRNKQAVLDCIQELSQAVDQQLSGC